MSTIYVDVDTQFDFCDPGGALFVRGAPAALPAIRRLVEHARRAGIRVLGSVDSHDFDAWEFARNQRRGPGGEEGLWPPHCVKGTTGWTKLDGTLVERFRFVPNVPPDLASPAAAAHYLRGAPQALYFEKEVYSLFANPLAARVLERLADGEDELAFVVFGVATDYCVKAAAAGLLAWAEEHRALRVSVALAVDALGAVDLQPSDGERALQSLAERGCKLVHTTELL